MSPKSSNGSIATEIEQGDNREAEKNAFEEVDKLGQGMSFGELALISHKPRAATVKALQATALAVVSKKDYQ